MKARLLLSVAPYPVVPRVYFSWHDLPVPRFYWALSEKLCLHGFLATVIWKQSWSLEASPLLVVPWSCQRLLFWCCESQRRWASYPPRNAHCPCQTYKAGFHGEPKQAECQGNLLVVFSQDCGYAEANPTRQSQSYRAGCWGAEGAEMLFVLV